MVTPRILRRRIRSIQNTAKITKAMEMIATAKMRRAQEQALAGRPYAESIARVIADLEAQPRGRYTSHPLLESRDVKRIAIVYITSDRGLCGGLNANLNRLVGGFVLGQTLPVEFVAVGRKGRDFLFRTGQNVKAEFTKMGDRPSLDDVTPISRIVIDDYSSGHIDLVYVAYSRFVSTMLQRPVMEPLLPVTPTAFAKGEPREYIYEPGPGFVLGQLVPRFVEMEVYHAILEAIASEQAARMVAMRSATDNASDIIRELTLMLNKARQEMITTELLDITGGAEALAKT
ncbi:MAG: ATP synthase F1 subunit gamma [Chloroflexota bacterium]